MRPAFHPSIIFCCFFHFTCIAQSRYSFSYVIPAEKYAGAFFKLEASIRSEIKDDSASARIWVRVDKKQGKASTFRSEVIRSASWTANTIVGTISPEATKIVFGTLSKYSGVFYYDNIKLSIKTNGGAWETVYQTGFENSLEGWQTGSFRDTPYDKSKFFTIAIAENNPSEGKACLKIEGKTVPNYGSDKKAGAYAKVNGINLYYEIHGSGKPLVVLHGNGSSIGGSEGNIDFFKDHYKVIAIDSRAQGRSIDTTTELTYELMASDVNELLNQLKIDSAYVWGQSDGAILALILAMNHPNKVKKAAAFAANIIPDTTAIEPPLFHDIEKKSKSSNAKEKQLHTLMWKHPNIPFPKLNTIKADVLIMSGDRDFVTLEHTVEIYKNIPRSNLCVIPGATHGASWEKPLLFQELVMDFFEKPFVMPSTVDWIKK